MSTDKTEQEAYAQEYYDLWDWRMREEAQIVREYSGLPHMGLDGPECVLMQRLNRDFNKRLKALHEKYSHLDFKSIPKKGTYKELAEKYHRL